MRGTAVRNLSRIVAVWTLALGLSQPAAAIPLTDLIGGGGFDSDNAELTFDNFDAEVNIAGLPFGGDFFEDLILTFSHVFPHEEGLAIFSPVIAIGIFHHVEVTLDVTFDVWADAGLEIIGAGISFLGFELGDAEAGATSAFFDGNTLLAELALGAEGFGFPSDSVIFDEGQTHLSVADLLSAEACGCGIAKAVKLIHSFETRPVPEPALLLLFGSGVLALRRSGYCA